MATGDHDWTAGEQVTAANMDDYLQLQTVEQFATAAARDAALSARKREGMVTHQADANSLTVYSGAAWSTIGPVHGAMTAWTPVVVQNNVPTLSVNSATYFRIGRLIFYDALVTITSAGTAANPVTISLPVGAKAGYSVYSILGTGYVDDLTGATTRYAAQMAFASTSTLKFHVAMGTGAADLGYLGAQGFTAALANGDIVAANGWYESSTDA